MANKFLLGLGCAGFCLGLIGCNSPVSCYHCTCQPISGGPLKAHQFNGPSGLDPKIAAASICGLELSSVEAAYLVKASPCDSTYRKLQAELKPIPDARFQTLAKHE